MSGRKKIIVVIILVVLGLSALLVYLDMRSLTGTISEKHSVPADNRSAVGVRGTKGESLTFKLTSSVKKGEVQFLITDSEGNILGTYGQDIKNQKIVFEKEDIYEIPAHYKDMVGKFRLKIYKK